GRMWFFSKSRATGSSQVSVAMSHCSRRCLNACWSRPDWALIDQVLPGMTASPAGAGDGDGSVAVVDADSARPSVGAAGAAAASAPRAARVAAEPGSVVVPERVVVAAPEVLAAGSIRGADGAWVAMYDSRARITRSRTASERSNPPVRWSPSGCECE